MNISSLTISQVLRPIRLEFHLILGSEGLVHIPATKYMALLPVLFEPYWEAQWYSTECMMM